MLPEDEPIRLKDAAAKFFPDGTMKVSGLRRERDRGNLVVERIANKEYTTLRHIKNMRERCRATPKEPVSGLNPRSETRMGGSQGAPHGSLGTERTKSALDALRQTARGLSKPLRSTSPENTKSRETAAVIRLKS
jgi:hypothetical protein